MFRVLILFAVVSGTSAQFVCPDMFGMFRHPDNCSIFFVCNYGMAHQRACPHRLLFDSGLSICRHSSDVHCLQQTQLLTAGFQCSSSVGLFPDPFSCEHFYLCANGYPYRQKCPLGLVFDGTLCNWKHDRSCRLQEKLMLERSIETGLNGRPKDPKRPSRIDIQKMSKGNTQKNSHGSFRDSTKTEISVNDSTTEKEKGDKERQSKVPTVTPVGSVIVPLESQHESRSTLGKNKRDNPTEHKQSAKEKTLQQTINITQPQLQTQPPKLQNRWKDLRRRQLLQSRLQQWMMQRQRKLHQKQQERKQRLQEDEKENRRVDNDSNITTISTRLMARKVTIKPYLVLSETISNPNINRKWWGTSWTEQSPRSEKKNTNLPWLFPIRQHTKSPDLIAIQAFGIKKSFGDSNNTMNTNFTNHDNNVINKNYSYGNVENRSRTTHLQTDKTINTDINFTTNNTTNKHNSNIYNNSHISKSNTISTSSNNSNRNDSFGEYNIDETINIDIISYNDTNVNVTNSFTSDTNTSVLNSTNDSDVHFDNETVSEEMLNDNSTDAMLVLRTSNDPNKTTDFSKSSAEKEMKKNLTTQNFFAS